MAELRLEPGPDHPITVEPTGGRVLVKAGDTIVADSTRALTLREADYPPVQYVPVADVDERLLRRTATTSYCPYKGDCGYYSIATSSGELTDAAWAYDDPRPAVREIAGHLAFYPDRLQIGVSAES
jgi:uncharacterized protein (DUF427 family)